MAFLLVEDLKGNPLPRSRIRTKTKIGAELLGDVSGARKGGLTTKVGKALDMLIEASVIKAEAAATELAQRRTGSYAEYFKKNGVNGWTSVRQAGAYWATNRFTNRRRKAKEVTTGWRMIYVRKKLDVTLSILNNFGGARFVFGGFTPNTDRQQKFHKAVGVPHATEIRDAAFGVIRDELQRNVPALLGDIARLVLRGLE
jgi:hypothetical protein